MATTKTTTKATTEAKNQLTLVERAQNFVATPIDFNRGVYNFSSSMYDEVTENGKAYIMAYEALDRENAKSNWQKAYILTHIYTEYVAEQRTKGEKASKSDFLKYWTGGKQSLYDLLSMGALVVKNADGTLRVPCDKNGDAFDLSNFVLIANRKGVKDEIAKGVWLASMSQVQIKAKKNELNRVVVDEPATEETEAEAEATEEVEAEAEATEEVKTEHHEPLEVWLNGKMVDLTAEQTKAILEIIGG